MNFFFRCFGGGGPKGRRRRRSSKGTSPPKAACRVPPFDGLHRPPPPTRFLPGGFAEKPALEQEVAGGGRGSPLSLSQNHEKGSPVCGKKKVTFDMNIKTYESIVNDEDPKHSMDAVNGGTMEEETELPKAMDKLQPNSGKFPLNHRYQNCDCVDEDDIGDENEHEGCDTDEQDYYQTGIEDVEEESYDSFFRLPVKTGQVNSHEANCPKMMRMSFSDREATISVKSLVHDMSQYANSMLNSVENISIYKEFEICADPIKDPEKENMNSELNNGMVYNSGSVLVVKKPEIPINAPNLSTKQEISLDASLSNWLASSDNTTFEGPQNSYSHRSLLTKSR